MDEFLKADRDWDRILSEVKGSDMETFEDLKEEKNRAFMSGMAWMYHEVETMRDQAGEEEGMGILERIEVQVREKALTECLEWLEGAMREMLEAMLDEEASGD